MERGIRVVKQNRIRTVSFYALTLPYAEFENKKRRVGGKKRTILRAELLKFSRTRLIYIPTYMAIYYII